MANEADIFQARQSQALPLQYSDQGGIEPPLTTSLVSFKQGLSLPASTLDSTSLEIVALVTLSLNVTHQHEKVTHDWS